MRSNMDNREPCGVQVAFALFALIGAFHVTKGRTTQGGCMGSFLPSQTATHVSILLRFMPTLH